MPPESTLPIDATGRLAIRSPGGAGLDIEARGAVLRVQVGSGRDLFRLWRDASRAVTADSALQRAQRAARLTDVDCVVHLRRHAIARLGPQTRPNPLSRLFGVAPARIEWRGLFAGLIDRRDTRS